MLVSFVSFTELGMLQVTDAGVDSSAMRTMNLAGPKVGRTHDYVEHGIRMRRTPMDSVIGAHFFLVSDIWIRCQRVYHNFLTISLALLIGDRIMVKLTKPHWARRQRTVYWKK